MNTPNPKQPRHEEESSVSSSIQNPNYTHPDFTRVLDQVLSSSCADGSSQDQLIDRTRKLVSLLQDSVEQRHASAHNYNSWPLPQELTITVFSMLDTKSLMQAAACCTMFNKCSMDPLCYSNIDLTMARKRIHFEVLCSMIHRSGKELRSLKLGHVTPRAIPMLTKSFLASKFLNGFTGDLLRSLHFDNCEFICTESLCAVLQVFPNLTDLRIFKLGKKHILEQVFKSLIGTHRLLEHLFIDIEMGDNVSGISILTSRAFVTYCPNIISLTLIGFHISEGTARQLAMGFPKLNYLNLSKTTGISGRFLSTKARRYKENNQLKKLILRDCSYLQKNQMLQFLESLVTGKYRFIRHIDVSNKYKRFSIPKVLLTKLKEERSDVRILGFRSI